jgi:putative hydrolase of the HAD superfamily
MPPKGILFDLFHTLTGLESHWAGWPTTSTLLGVDRTAWNQALLERSRWRLVGEERDPVAIVRALAHLIDPCIGEDQIRAATAARIERFRQVLVRIPEENLDALRRLRDGGFRLGLISNADAMEAAAWPESPLRGMFEVEALSCHVGCAKPEPEIYGWCLERLGLTAADCLFVGDGGSGELEGARAAGMRTVLVYGVIEELWPDVIPPRRELADHSVRFVPDLLPLVGLVPGRPLAGNRPAG